MKNPNIGKRLKYYRTMSGFSVKEVAKQLEQHGESVSIKSIYSWENGTTQPSADTLMYLCEIYKVNDVLSAFGYNNQSEEKTFANTLTYDEMELIQAYREKAEYKSTVRKIYDLEVSDSNKNTQP